VPTEVAAAAAAAASHEGSTGVIVPDALFDACAAALHVRGLEWRKVDEIAAGGVTLLRAAEAKGLEFDDVVLAEPAAIADSANGRGLNTLYVALTRAVMRLVVVHAKPMPLLFSD
jgi:superfamily I DNA/RNA helicase